MTFELLWVRGLTQPFLLEEFGPYELIRLAPLLHVIEARLLAFSFLHLGHSIALLWL